MGQEIDWESLAFNYFPTAGNMRCWYRNGEWGKLEWHEEDSLSLSIASMFVHYGQAVFEGLKVFRCQDGKVRTFRMRDNALRMNRSCHALSMPELPVEIFEEGVRETVRRNIDYVPPYGKDASLYVRPFIIGTTPQIGVRPAKDYLFGLFVVPVGAYFKSGFKPTDVLIVRDYDRAAPLGLGAYKVAGNYAASLVAGNRAQQLGYSMVLYLDAKEKKYIDECGPANFLAIKEDVYVTPNSHSILPSITNKSLQVLAKEEGLRVERRRVPVEELADFSEVAACGTAAVIAPIKKVADIDKGQEYYFGEEPGAYCVRLYNRLRAIQVGDEEDVYGWTVEI